MRRIAIVYDLGSAGVYDIISALEDFAIPVFVCGDSQHEEFPYDVMSEFGALCDIRGMSLPAAAERLREFSPEGIVTFSDHVLDLAEELADALGLPFHDIETVHALTRKSVQRRLLNACGASRVATRLVRDSAALSAAWAEVGGPAVLKPDTGTGSRSTYRLVTEKDFRQACREVFPDESVPAAGHEPFVLEAEIPSPGSAGPWGDYVSVDSVVSEGSIEHLAVCGKFPLAEPFRETGSFFPDALPRESRAAVTEVVDRALHGLGVRWGIFHTEVKLSPDGPQVIEVNGRLGGRVNDLLRRTGGPNAIEIAARVALGDRRGLPKRPPSPSSGVAFMYAKVPPADAVGLLTVDGMDALRRRPEVSRVLALQEPGQEIDWRSGRLGHTYICFGKVETHTELESLVSELDDIVRVTYLRSTP
ncbi:ATP-grasp domain-containing protein [Streptomyces macrosporus]|uniref:ATP-grasp domain-containing protein n=1 Tax=Streptomyces macrosporus TaxID=44032 RepID=A0ABP5XMQ3_9ACTN